MKAWKPTLAEEVLAEVSILANVLRSRPHPQTLPPKAANLLLLLQSEGPCSVPQLARLCQTSRQNTQVIVNSLIRSSLVRTAANPAHKRSALIELTTEGIEKLRSVEASKETLTQKLRTACADAELQTTLRTLRQLQQAVRATNREQPAPEKPRHGERVERENVSPALRSEEELPVSLL